MKPWSLRSPGPHCSLPLGLTAPGTGGTQAASPRISDPRDGDVPAEPHQAGGGGWQTWSEPPEQHEGCPTCRRDKRTPKTQAEPRAGFLPEETQIPHVGGVTPQHAPAGHLHSPTETHFWWGSPPDTPHPAPSRHHQHRIPHCGLAPSPSPPPGWPEQNPPSPGERLPPPIFSTGLFLRRLPRAGSGRQRVGGFGVEQSLSP